MDMYQKRKVRKENKKEENNSTTNINWYPGHMAKTKREITSILGLIDVVYEVIDSRMPLSSKINDIDDLIKDKPKIMVFTKYDLCDKFETDKFVDYYKELGYKVVCGNLVNDKNIVKKIFEESSEIINSINQKRIAKGMKPRTLRAIVVGAPNVGKSTLINKLVGKNKAIVGNKPGVTKALSWIRLNKEIELLDTPGILYPKFDNQEHAYNLASLSSIKEEIVDNASLSLHILKFMNKLYPESLNKRYGIEKIDFSNIIETYDVIAKKRGAIMRGGEANYEKVYLIIIQDLKNNLLGNITIDRISDIIN